jgi:hypothetical protein
VKGPADSGFFHNPTQKPEGERKWALPSPEDLYLQGFNGRVAGPEAAGPEANVSGSGCKPLSRAELKAFGFIQAARWVIHGFSTSRTIPLSCGRRDLFGTP